MRTRFFCMLLVAVIVGSCSKSYHFQYTDLMCKGRGQGGSKQIALTTKAGKSKDLEQSAKKDAIHALIFRGVLLGNGECPRSPIVPNSSESDPKNKAFFDQFFASPSNYEQFILSVSLQSPPGVMKVSDGGYRGSYLVTVNYDQLVKYLENQGITRSLKIGM